VLLTGALATGSRMLNTDSDLGRHLTLGGYILSSHTIPNHDVLSFTMPGDSRPPYEWLAQVLLALAYRILGLDGVVLLTSLVIAIAFSIVYMDSVRRSGRPILSLVIVAWAAIASSLHWLARPHVFSFLFFALWLGGLERLRRREPMPLWLFPAMMLLWANTHGGFIFGFLALGAYLADWIVDALQGSVDRTKGLRLLTVGVASGLASILTPDLWHNWEAVLSNRSGYVLSRTVETMPLNLASRAVWPFLAMLVLAVALLTIQRSRVATAPVALLAVLALASLAMVRNIPFFAIAAAPFLIEWTAQIGGGLTDWQRIETRFQEIDRALTPFLWSAIAATVAVAFFGYAPVGSRVLGFEFRPDVFPVKAADWVAAHPRSGRMFNDFNWGGYLLYRFWPEQKVFIDSQSDFYGEALTRQAEAIAAGESGWEDSLDLYHVSWMLIPRNAGLAEAASKSPLWSIAYQDDIAVVLVHK
jgi:hypothetical protein